MTFFALSIASAKSERLEPLKMACKKLGIAFQALDPYSFDFSKPSPVKKGDMIYRTNRGKLLRFFEDYIVQPGVVTFYNNELFHKPDPFLLQKQGIEVPKTIFCLSNDRKQLAGYVKKLGGFPIVLKALGGTRGMGVVKVDSFPSLFSLVDFLTSQGKLLVLRQYIPVKASARFIVLGDEVIASLEYKAPNNDFRTNAAQKLSVKSKKYPKMFEEMAVRATKAMGWEFGGVDILIHGGKGYVSEVNFPCNFIRAQKATGKDIAFQMVKYLQQKSEQLK